jgi:glycosyltransferase involved in cell wall biosynthesis
LERTISVAPNGKSVNDGAIEVSVVMPCLNEAQTLATCIQKAQASLLRLGVRGEIVIADNGSSDGSQQIARSLGVRVVDVPIKGYGSALMAGITSAEGPFVIMGDADDSYDFTLLEPFIEKLRAGYDLVMGNRFRGGIGRGAMPPLHQYLGNPVLTFVGRLFFKSPVGDFHCGLRGLNKAAIIGLDLRTTGMEFASEMVVKATLHGLRIAEVPTRLFKDGRGRPSNLRTWRDGWRHLRFLFLYSPRWLFLYPGILLMAGGLIVGPSLIPSPRVIGGIVFDIHTLLYAALAIVIGFQAIIFATFTKVFAITEGLLPSDPKLDRVMKYVTLETGLLVGVFLFLLGLGGSIYAVLFWDQHSFGRLDPARTLRFVIPAVTALMLGCQIILSSFFLSILGLRRR